MVSLMLNVFSFELIIWVNAENWIRFGMHPNNSLQIQQKKKKTRGKYEDGKKKLFYFNVIISVEMHLIRS